MSLLTINEKERIFRDVLSGTTKAELARRYGVSSRTIGRAFDEMQAKKQSEQTKQDSNYYYQTKPAITPSNITEDDDYDDEDFDYDTTDYEDEEFETINVDIEPTYKVVATANTITIHRVTPTEVITTQISKQQNPEKFDRAMAIVKAGFDDENLAKAFKLIDSASSEILKLFSEDGLTVDRERGEAYYTDQDGNKVSYSGSLLQSLVRTTSSRDLEFTTLKNFAIRLAKNPSNRAIRELYDFLKCTSIEIHPDGRVECFKKVRSDMMDIYSGTFNNSVGNILSVPRNMVDENSAVTCSYGLHVCSYDYLHHYGSYYGSAEFDKVVKVLVDPADFVAIPPDYNNAKARVCKYEVISIVD